jgi:hypothetical protein
MIAQLYCLGRKEAKSERWMLMLIFMARSRGAFGMGISFLFVF